jgi:hypothetical protein
MVKKVGTNDGSLHVANDEIPCEVTAEAKV